MGTSTKEGINNLIKSAATVMITMIITMSGFWMMIGRDFVTRAEVNELIQQRVSTIAATEERLERVVTKNTDAINHFNIQIATLNQTLIHIKEDMNRRDDSREAINAESNPAIFASQTSD
jgi:hypothetical protein